ncbi:MAG: type IV pilus assembly protein PilM [Candidatus Moraniibacteriota bacterium]
MGGFFQKNNFFKKSEAFGVDFSKSALKIIQLENDKHGKRVVGWSKKKMPKGLIDSYLINDFSLFKKVFNDSIIDAKGSFRGNNLVLSVPETKIFTRVVEIPLMRKDEANEAVKWESESNIPISIDSVYYDWEIIKKKKQKMDVLVMASPKKVIDNYLSAFESIGYEVVAFEPESVANGRSIIGAKDSGFLLLVDIGMDYGNFVLYDKNVPIFTANSSVCGKVFTDAVVKQLGTSFEKAESYKIKTGLGKNKKEKEEVFNTFKPILENLVEDIEKTIDFFQNNLFKEMGDKKIKKVVLTGGGSNLRGLDAYLSSRLNREVVKADPWSEFNFNKRVPPISKDDAQNFSTAIGLSLRAQEYENFD